MRLAVYGGVSTLLSLGIILSAMHQRSNFYAACVYLSKSSACVMILLNMGFLVSILLGKALQAIFFGELRAIEVEHLYERSWYAVTETCLAMTIFRDEFDLHFVIVFTTLLFLKIFHWLCQDRVDFMEQTPANRITFHARMVNLMLLLLIIDCLLAHHAIDVSMKKGANMMIMFGFEYTILICTMLSVVGRYILNVIDMRSEEPWENKSMYVFYLDLVTEFFKLITYLVFFLFICIFYQLPLHIIRDVYVTFRSFIQKCRDLYRYRRATRNMNELYANATAEDLSRTSDNTCIICREEMRANDTESDGNAPAPANREREQNVDQPKKLPCGHIFHFHCLRSWLERQQSCPTCRRSVLSDGQDSLANVARSQSAGGPAADALTSEQQRINQQQSNLNFPVQHQQETQPVPQQQIPDNASRPTSTNGLPVASFTATPQSSYINPNPAHLTTATNMPLGILTPQNNNSTQGAPPSFSMNSPFPGMIPLVPLSGVPFHSSDTTQQPTTSRTVPTVLTEEQLAVLSTNTRESIVQQLRVLETVQSQIFECMQVLARTLSVIPEANTNTTTTQEANPASEGNTQQSSPAEQSSNDKSTEGGHNVAESSTAHERKGKMAEHTSEG
ncbi:E3 ubiquitin-protein ligase hrd1 [Apophysomyces ossiformis]|uniref:RING-type E3 ubiquitin transferase n=1 Tax=Apophysomyces ossiformis TaxID=679940 RepID=A0A8H7BHE3_9FUNG|nr:E3 ubiquitin-protein ligase hrd1 [Apophysomyces ossiformis]